MENKVGLIKRKRVFIILNIVFFCLLVRTIYVHKYGTAIICLGSLIANTSNIKLISKKLSI